MHRRVTDVLMFCRQVQAKHYQTKLQERQSVHDAKKVLSGRVAY